VDFGNNACVLGPAGCVINISSHFGKKNEQLGAISKSIAPMISASELR
jgi:hypothetical protein